MNENKLVLERKKKHKEKGNITEHEKEMYRSVNWWISLRIERGGR